MQTKYTITAVIISTKRPPPTLPPIIIHYLFLQRNVSQMSSFIVLLFCEGGISVEPLWDCSVGFGGTTGPVFKVMSGLKIKA